MSFRKVANFYPNLLFRHISDDTPNISEFNMHLHDGFELLYFIKGQADFIIETTTYKLYPHSLIITQPMESHQLKVTAMKPYERFTLHFPAEFLDTVDPQRKLAEPFTNRPLGINNLYDASEFAISPLSLLSAMESPYYNETEQYTNIIIYLYALLGQLYEAYSVKKNNSFESARSPVYDIVQYINKHLYEQLSLKEIASMFYLSESQLSRIFKKAAGIPLWEYIVNKRLTSARRAIQSGIPATAAFTECGFKDYSSFYRMYVKKFGSSPKQDFIKKTNTFTDDF